MVNADEPLAVRITRGEIYPAVRATLRDEPVAPGLVLKERQRLAQDADSFGGPVHELRLAGDRLPVPAHEGPHGRAWPDPGDPFVLRFT